MVNYKEETNSYDFIKRHFSYDLTNRIEDNDSINKNKPIENQPKPIIKYPDQKLHQNNVLIIRQLWPRFA